MPAFVPTPEQRETVLNIIGTGGTEDDVRRAIGGRGRTKMLSDWRCGSTSTTS